MSSTHQNKKWGTEQYKKGYNIDGGIGVIMEGMMSRVEPLYRKKIAWQMVCPLCKEDVRDYFTTGALRSCDCGEWRAETLNGTDLYWEHSKFPNRQVEKDEEGNCSGECSEEGNYYAKS